MITIKEYLGDKVFYWAEESKDSPRVRFTKREFERSVKPRLFFK